MQPYTNDKVHNLNTGQTFISDKINSVEVKLRRNKIQGRGMCSEQAEGKNTKGSKAQETFNKGRSSKQFTFVLLSNLQHYHFRKTISKTHMAKI